MNELITLFKNSISDHVLTRSEKKEIKNIIVQEKLSQRELAVLRSEIFKIARSHCDNVPVENLIDWIEATNKLTLILNENPIQNSRVYFSPGNECRNAIIHNLRQANNNIKVCLFTISDNEISDELINAKKRGVLIQIITDDDKLHDMGSDINMLEKSGIHIKIDNHKGHMHHKFCIIDQETVITGSYNWTKSAAERNFENVLINNERQIISSFQSEFKELWKSLKTL